MTTANKVTIFRILLVPAFVVQLLYYFESENERDRLLAIVLFAFAAILDGVDGYIARRYNQKSELGAILDPLGDKFLLLSAISLLSIYNQTLSPRIPMWLMAVVASKDVILVLGMIIIYYTCGKLKVVPRIVGKASTVLQIILVLWALMKWDVSFLWWLSLVTAIITAIAGIQYVRDGIKQLGQSPLSSPDHRL